ncbi:hypothetical protein GF324_11830 [bacterium]|nr:hypothetical protein [bacterium]
MLHRTLSIVLTVALGLLLVIGCTSEQRDNAKAVADLGKKIGEVQKKLKDYQEVLSDVKSETGEKKKEAKEKLTQMNKRIDQSIEEVREFAEQLKKTFDMKEDDPAAKQIDEMVESLAVEWEQQKKRVENL